MLLLMIKISGENERPVGLPEVIQLNGYLAKEISISTLLIILNCAIWLASRFFLLSAHHENTNIIDKRK